MYANDMIEVAATIARYLNFIELLVLKKVFRVFHRLENLINLKEA